MSQNLPLVMPRRFAIQLLHEAQIAGSEGFLAAVAAGVLPDAYFIAAPGSTLESLLGEADVRFTAPTRALWAIYLHRPGQPTAPTPADFALRPQTLRLTASLATKGVLQLRAWVLDEQGRVQERTLQIDD